MPKTSRILLLPVAFASVFFLPFFFLLSLFVFFAPPQGRVHGAPLITILALVADRPVLVVHQDRFFHVFDGAIHDALDVDARDGFVVGALSASLFLIPGPFFVAVVEQELRDAQGAPRGIAHRRGDLVPFLAWVQGQEPTATSMTTVTMAGFSLFSVFYIPVIIIIFFFSSASSSFSILFFLFRLLPRQGPDPVVAGAARDGAQCPQSSSFRTSTSVALLPWILEALAQIRTNVQAHMLLVQLVPDQLVLMVPIVARAV
jgi:hypothetical protein